MLLRTPSLCLCSPLTVLSMSILTILQTWDVVSSVIGLHRISVIYRKYIGLNIILGYIILIAIISSPVCMRINHSWPWAKRSRAPGDDAARRRHCNGGGAEDGRRIVSQICQRNDREITREGTHREMHLSTEEAKRGQEWLILSVPTPPVQ